SRNSKTISGTNATITVVSRLLRGTSVCVNTGLLPGSAAISSSVADYIAPADAARMGPRFAPLGRRGGMMPNRVPVVAVFNSNEDVVEMLRAAIEHAGMVCVSTHVDEVKRGDSSLGSFMTEHDPMVIIYDLVPPYDRS